MMRSSERQKENKLQRAELTRERDALRGSEREKEKKNYILYLQWQRVRHLDDLMLIQHQQEWQQQHLELCIAKMCSVRVRFNHHFARVTYVRAPHFVAVNVPGAFS